MPEIGQLFTASEASAYRTLPRTLRILAENTLRNGYRDDTLAILERRPAPLRLRPTRLVMQDLLAVPLLADLASLREELAERHIDPARVNPQLPTDLVIDHSMTVEHFGNPEARRLNEEREILINRERFTTRPSRPRSMTTNCIASRYCRATATSRAVFIRKPGPTSSCHPLW